RALARNKGRLLKPTKNRQGGCARALAEAAWAAGCPAPRGYHCFRRLPSRPTPAHAGVNAARLRFRAGSRGVGQSPPRAPYRPSRPLLTRTFTATRRFCALPAAVLLSAIGSALDMPVGVSMR